MLKMCFCVSVNHLFPQTNSPNHGYDTGWNGHYVSGLCCFGLKGPCTVSCWASCIIVRGLAVGWWSVRSPPPGAMSEPLPCLQWHTQSDMRDGRTSSGVVERNCLRLMHRDRQSKKHKQHLIKAHDARQLTMSQHKASMDRVWRKI